MSSPLPPLAAEAVRVLELEAQAILAAAQRLKSTAGSQSFVNALTCIEKSLLAGGRVVVTGLGKSGKIAQKIAATLSSTGSPAFFLHPTEALHGDIGNVRPGDVTLALSASGNTEEIMNLIPALRLRQTPIIGLVGSLSSRLGTEADFAIDASIEAEACPHNLAPTTSTTLALALGDAIAMALMKRRDFAIDQFASNHPGGALGKRLGWKVQDVMHSGDAVAWVSPTAPMDEVAVRSTQKKLGAVLVVDGRKLLGIITDGDLRRALQHREKFFQLRASDVMTAQPVTVQTDDRAADALDRMQNRPSQISVLPVVDASGHWKGILRLHDLIRNL